MSQVIKLTPVSGICNNSKEVAGQLRIPADEIEAGQWDDVRIATTVMDTDQGVHRCTFGPPGTNKIEVVGLLTYGIHRIIE
jgi:hypothetical protein